MKRHAALPFALLLLACSSTPTATPTVDAGADDATPDANDPNTPYEHAVLSSQWKKLAAGPTVGGGAKQDDLWFTSALVGYAASGPTESIWKTTDGGTSWNKVFTHKGTYFRSVAFLDDLHGFAGNLGAGLSGSITDTTVLYETKDGGGTWNPVTNITGPAASGICNLTVIDAQHIVAVGRANGPSFMLSSSDGGASWTSIDLNTDFTMVIDARFTSPTEGIVVGQDAAKGRCVVKHTADGGKTFDSVFLATAPGSLCWKISFPSNNVGYIAIQDEAKGPPAFAKTIDGGKTWVEMPLPAQSSATAPFPAIGIGFITDNVGWVSPEDSSMPTYLTTDGGQTWTQDATLESPINRFRFVDKNTAYAIGAATWKLDITWK